MNRTDAHSTVHVTTNFANKVHTTIFASLSSAAALTDATMLKEIQNAVSELHFEKPGSHFQFEIAAKNLDCISTTIAYNNAVAINMQLHVRHSYALVLRSLLRLVTSKIVGEPLHGRPRLKRFGSDLYKVFAAAVTRHHGASNIPIFIANTFDNSSGRIGRLLGKVFHVDGALNDAALDDNDGWLNFVPGHPAKEERVQKLKLEETRNHGLFSYSCTSLERLPYEFDNTVKPKLNEVISAEIEPLKIQLNSDSAPVWVMRPRYTRSKREFMKCYRSVSWTR